MQAFATPRRKLFARRNYSKHQFSHVPSRFQLNVNFKQSPWICKYFQPMAINSSLSCIYEQIFRLLLKISVCERHQLRIQTIFIKLPTGKQYYLQLQNLLLHSTFIPAFQTIPNESFHQIIDINSSRAQKQKWETLLKMTWKPTAPSVPRRSPIQVLTRLNVA